MAATLSGVERFRNLIDGARGTETYASLAFRLGESEQWLSNKLRGARGIDVPEVLRIAQALDLDPVGAVCERWPELGAADRLRGLRLVLASATASEIDALAEVAQQMIAARGDDRPKRRGKR